LSKPRRRVPPRTILARVRRLRGLGRDRAESALTTPSLEDLMRHSRPRLLECARCVGLTGVQRLTKAEIGARVRRALETLAAMVRAEESADAPHKFDLGRAPAGAVRDENIPWGYGEDRVTAMVVDPENLYVYWEVTDEAIARAREGLGAGGRDAWPNLRVYDVTDRIFDGTNAHHYFDHAVSRSDRQWFFFIGRPSSTVVVELGLKSREGYFVRIARSGRTDFPRREPAPAGPVEWLTVRSATGEVGEPSAGERGISPAVVEGASVAQPEFARAWDIRRILEGREEGGWDGDWIVRDESVRTAAEGWSEWTRTMEWEGPVIRTSWEAGPFPYPVEPPPYVEERYEGPVTVRAVNGQVRVVHSVRQIVIRGIGARAERRVLGVWELRRSWLAREGVEVLTAGGAATAPGGSEQVALGASERHWRAASELRLWGASEIYLASASELRYLGASERLWSGASEWRARGASEQRFLGASEWRERGASERRWGGASEQRFPGASERAWPGASEQRPRYPDGPPRSG